jgi:hypothetical protein
MDENQIVALIATILELMGNAKETTHAAIVSRYRDHLKNAMESRESERQLAKQDEAIKNYTTEPKNYPTQAPMIVPERSTEEIGTAINSAVGEPLDPTPK